MPMNRHLTWGDRQADVARDRNLKRLQKLAAMAPPAQTPSPEATQATAKSKPVAKPAAKSAAQSAAKKAAPAKAPAKKKSTKK